MCLVRLIFVEARDVLRINFARKFAAHLCGIMSVIASLTVEARRIAEVRG